MSDESPRPLNLGSTYTCRVVDNDFIYYTIDNDSEFDFDIKVTISANQSANEEGREDKQGRTKEKED
jgi:hypothetical protein